MILNRESVLAHNGGFLGKRRIRRVKNVEHPIVAAAWFMLPWMHESAQAAHRARKNL
jgi:hypothetical protein